MTWIYKLLYIGTECEITTTRALHYIMTGYILLCYFIHFCLLLRVAFRIWRFYVFRMINETSATLLITSVFPSFRQIFFDTLFVQLACVFVVSFCHQRCVHKIYTRHVTIRIADGEGGGTRTNILRLYTAMYCKLYHETIKIKIFDSHRVDAI